MDPNFWPDPEKIISDPDTGSSGITSSLNSQYLKESIIKQKILFSKKA